MEHRSECTHSLSKIYGGHPKKGHLTQGKVTHYSNLKIFHSKK